MRILYLAPNIVVPGSHGGSTHVTSVHRALVARGHELLLIARRGSTEPGALAIGEGIGTPLRHVLPAFYLARAWRAVRRFAPDVVYERYSAYGLGPVLGRLLGVPSVLMTLDRDASPLSLAGAELIAATSDSFLAPRHRAKWREVRWGVDVDAFASADGSAVRARLAPGGDKLVVYTGSCARWHGLDVLVEVAASWTGPQARFVVVGDGEDRAAVETLARRRGVAERFVFVGRVAHTEAARYVAAADVCVAPYAPSRHPLFRRHGMDRDPIKVLEFMAAGAPCVTIDTPRMRRLFEAGVELALYPPENAAALRRELESLLADGERAARMGAAAAARVRRDYTWARHAEELEAIFREAIERWSGRGASARR